MTMHAITGNLNAFLSPDGTAVPLAGSVRFALFSTLVAGGDVYPSGTTTIAAAEDGAITCSLVVPDDASVGAKYAITLPNGACYELVISQDSPHDLADLIVTSGIPVSALQQLLAMLEPDLGAPPADGYVLSSLMDTTRSWVAPSVGDVTQQDMDDAVAAEATAREDADDLLAQGISTALTSEATTRATADTTNATAIAAESSARQSADATLQTALGTETTNRQSGDITNATAITAEATARSAADTTLQASITANATAIATETANRTTADATLQTDINTRLTQAAGDARYQPLPGAWVALTLAGNWTNYSTGSYTVTPAYRIEGSVVRLRGTVKRSTGTDTIIATGLPAPTFYQSPANAAGTGATFLEITSGGQLNYLQGATSRFSLDGVTYALS